MLLTQFEQFCQYFAHIRLASNGKYDLMKGWGKYSQPLEQCTFMTVSKDEKLTPHAPCRVTYA